MLCPNSGSVLALPCEKQIPKVLSHWLSIRWQKQAMLQARTDAQNSSEVSQRQSRLGATLGDVQATFESSLKNIAGLPFGPQHHL